MFLLFCRNIEGGGGGGGGVVVIKQVPLITHPITERLNLTLILLNEILLYLASKSARVK